MSNTQFTDHPLIQSVVPMVFKKSNAIYNNRISSADRRWIDPEDVIQEGLLAAFLAQGPGAWSETGGAKFSTYAFRRIDMEHRRRILEKQGRASRKLDNVVELDRPDPETGTTLDVADIKAHADTSVIECDFIELCSRVSGEAATMLIRGLLCDDFICEHHSRAKLLLAEIREALADTGLTRWHLSQLANNKESKISILWKLSTDANIEVSAMEAKVLQCIECDRKFNLQDVRDENFFVDTSTCKKCYLKLAALPATVSCFGKEKLVYESKSKLGGTKVIEGFSANDVECTLHCQDRVVCRQFIQEKTMSDEELLDDLDFDEIAEEAVQEVVEAAAPKAAKAKKPKADAAKPAKKKPAAEPVAKKPVKGADKKAAPVKAVKKTAVKKEEPKKKAVVTPISKGAKKIEKPAKSEKPVKAKAKKVAAAPKGDSEVVPEKYRDQVGDRWPHKAGSMMRAAFQYCLKGIKKDKLKEETEAINHDFALVYRVLQKNQSPTHYWRLVDENNFLRLYDVRPKTAKEAEQYRAQRRSKSAA